MGYIIVMFSDFKYMKLLFYLISTLKEWFIVRDVHNELGSIAPALKTAAANAFVTAFDLLTCRKRTHANAKRVWPSLFNNGFSFRWNARTIRPDMDCVLSRRKEMWVKCRNDDLWFENEWSSPGGLNSTPPPWGPPKVPSR